MSSHVGAGPGSCWELKLGPMEEWLVLLPVELSQIYLEEQILSFFFF